MKGENEVQESTRKTLRNGAIRDHAVQIVPLPQPDRILMAGHARPRRAERSPIVAMSADASGTSHPAEQS